MKIKTGHPGRPPKGEIKISQSRWEKKSAYEAIRSEIFNLVDTDWKPTRFFTSSELNKKYEKWYCRERALKALRDLEKSDKIESIYDKNFNEWYWRLK